VYAGLPDTDEAIRWLTQALDSRSPTVVLMNVDPFLDPLRSDHRFQRLLGRLNLLS
jgi:hypothetical protein